MSKLDEAVRRLAAIPPRVPCDRAQIVADRGINLGWFDARYRASIIGTIRIALDMEVEAGGAFEVERRADEQKEPT